MRNGVDSWLCRIQLGTGCGFPDAAYYTRPGLPAGVFEAPLVAKSES